MQSMSPQTGSKPQQRGRDRRKILAVASGGGHWIQLLRLRKAFGGFEVVYVSTLDGLTVSGAETLIVREASRTDRLALAVLFVQLLWITIKVRPEAVVTTGAAPGVIALKIARLFRIRTVWIDSIANVDELSLSGRIARSSADLWLTQWPHLTEKYDGLQYRGSIL